MADAQAQLWDTDDVATFLQVDERTVRRMRAAGEGPAYIRLGSSIRYIPGTVYRWVSEQQGG